MQAREGLAKPRVSLWLTGLKETIAQLPDFVRVAARHRRQGGLSAAPRVLRAKARSAWRAPTRRCSNACTRRRRAISKRPRRRRQTLGISFNASGATEPGTSLARKRRREPVVALPPAVDRDVLHRQRPRAALLHRAVLAEGLRELHAGRRHAGRRLREIWNGPAYQDFRKALLSDAPPKSCANCGLRWSL